MYRLMKNNNISSSSGAAKSLLPEKVRNDLQRDRAGHYGDDSLFLAYKKIDDSMIPELCEWLIKLEGKVKVLNLRDNEITSTGTSMLFDMLRATNSSIKEIYLSDNKQIDDGCMKSLGEYIKSNKSIERIYTWDNTISNTGIEILAPYIDGNTTFKVLHLSRNKGITDKSIPLLVKMIESSHTEDMNIDYTSITQKNIVVVSLAYNSIRIDSNRLFKSEKNLYDDDVIKICNGMKKYGIDKLKEIYLFQNKITSKGASVLFDTLRECNSVVSMLNLSYNEIDDECMKQLGEYLQDNEYLEELKLDNNTITDNGIEMISEYLIGNITLKVLNLYGNKGITDVSVPHLVEIAKKLYITSIYLVDTSISDEKVQEIDEALSIPIEQREIPIKSNTKSAAKLSVSVSTSTST